MSRAMQCKDIVWKIGPHVDGELPREETEEVETHLAGCSECAEMAVEFRRLDWTAAREKAPPVSSREWAILWEGVQSGVRPRTQENVVTLSKTVRARRWIAPFLLGAAAMFLLGVFVGSGFFKSPEPAPVLVDAPKTQPTDGTDGFAERRSGPAIIRVDDDVIIIEHPNF